MKIATIIGARPQFIKASVLSNLIVNESNLEEIIIHTGQHFDSMMSDIFFNESLSIIITIPFYLFLDRTGRNHIFVRIYLLMARI